jgi:hypothetical protein
VGVIREISIAQSKVLERAFSCSSGLRGSERKPEASSTRYLAELASFLPMYKEPYGKYF